MIKQTVSPIDFFKHLVWLDGTPLLDTIEHYRRRIFMDALYSFDDDGRPHFNMALVGRGKKNFKTSDLCLAALYKLLVWVTPYGNDCLILANDLDQAGDDLALIKKLIEVNPILDAEVTVKQKSVERRDGKGTLSIIAARDAVGAHGKTALFIGFDEIHGYKDYDILEALAPDPTRLDTMTWITSYNTIHSRPGIPLFDLIKQGKAGTDPRMYFAWYAGDFTTDPEFQGEGITPEQRANPSMENWGNPDYLEQQRRRLPSHRYRRLHLNLPGMPDGTYLDAEAVEAAIDSGIKQRPPQDNIIYKAFVDMSGGSNDDAAFAIAHRDAEDQAVLDVAVTQAGRAPFNPRNALAKFAGICREYGISTVTGDAYAGETFRADFEAEGITYKIAPFKSASAIYEAFEPKLNTGAVRLLDNQKLTEQLLGLVIRGQKITHQNGEHDDLANAACGALMMASRPVFKDEECIASPVSVGRGPSPHRLNDGPYRPY